MTNTLSNIERIIKPIFDDTYSGSEDKLIFVGPNAMRQILSPPSTRKTLGLRARAYRLGKKRAWWSGGGYPISTTGLAIDRLPKIKTMGYGIDINEWMAPWKSMWDSIQFSHQKENSNHEKPLE